MTSNIASSPVAVGQARRSDALTSAQQAARMARERMGDQQPGWALAFVGGKHDPQAVLEGFRTELGAIPVLGGAGSGTIVAEGASTTGYECALLLFSTALMPKAVIREDLGDDEAAAGRRLGYELQTMNLAPDTVVLVFYDSIKSSPPPVLHLGSRLLDGLHEGLGKCAPLIVGAGAIGDMHLSSSYLFDGRGASRHSAIAIVLPETLVGHTTISHGCLPASDFLEITALQGARVLELNRRPALRVVEERLGVARAELLARKPFPALTLGEKHGDLFDPFNDNQYVNRLVIGIDPDNEALVLFESDFHIGSQVQLMSYEPQRMVESARDQTEALVASLDHSRLVFGFYIDCAGRSMAFSGADDDESAPVREQVARHCPFLGVYSGVEIAPFLGRARPLDWTGVLLLCTQG